ncbi:Protein IQ-DOMAIN 11 [Linum perenne]
MGKPWNWFKRLFASDSQSNLEKKEKRRKWVLFDVKNRLASSITAPPPTTTLAITTTPTLDEDDKEEHQAKVGVDVDWQSQSDKQHSSPLKPQEDHAAVVDGFWILRYQRDLQEFSATKIQSTFRGFLARKALRALKGIVMLQAMIRGRNVRRQAITALKCLESLVNIQSQTAAASSSSSRRNSFPMVDYNETTCQFDERTNQFQYLKDKIIKVDKNSQRTWDSSLLTKEEADALYMNKIEASMKRERIKDYYSFCHRSSSDSDRSKPDGKLRQWLVEWEDKQIDKKVVIEEEEGEDRAKHLKVRGLRRHHIEEVNSPISRRSLQQRKQASFSYMAATESAKAKVRSLSSPRIRPGSVEAYNSDGISPYKNRRLFLSAAAACHGNGRNNSSYYCNYNQQRSPSLKSLPAGGMRSNRRTLKDLSIDSGCSFKTWDPQCAF